ncbi:uncharacterized protein LOC113209400 [Frankliniella occidentalis]|uniref:Uncharacterized protein LOC113209400 n=1 Tax=Frankliniella occidentalis TaxID=133901 RepID=A0A6J1STL7_FRAOC|nr:uncharacterized protein LOC113209400 [Frankliniella occidentalis]
MECDICLEDYNQAERVPKMVPCGHTVCLLCLQRSVSRQCPTCRRVVDGPPDALPNNFTLLRLIEDPAHSVRPLRGWCSDCRATTSPRCWDEEHDILPEKKALRRYLQGALQKAAGQLEAVEDLCQGEQVDHALTLLSAESWNLTLQGGGHELTGTVGNTEDPLTQLMWLLLAAKATLSKSRVQTLPPTSASPPPAAAGSPPPGTQGPPPAAASPPPAAPSPRPLRPEAQPLREMTVYEISLNGPNKQKKEKAALLAKAPGVTRLLDVSCHKDSAWSLQLLQRVAPSIEELAIVYPREPHLRALHAMPRLRRLQVSGGDAAMRAQPPELPALPPGHAGLQWLRVIQLPRATTQSLLRAHGRSLEELQLLVGTAGRDGRDGWPVCCGDLPSLLQQSGLQALKRLVLRRFVTGHEPAACSEQRAEVRPVLPGVEVLCGWCDRVRLEEF